MPRISACGHNRNNLMTRIKRKYKMHLQEIIDVFATCSQNKSLTMNSRKTEVASYIKRCIPNYNIKVNGTWFKQVSLFKYIFCLDACR